MNVYDPTYALYVTLFVTYVNCCMFRHQGAILRESLRERYASQLESLGSATLHRDE